MYKTLCEEKGAKEREWYSKMSGFYKSAKFTSVEVKD
jgi:hypothetical protein